MRVVRGDAEAQPALDVIDGGVAGEPIEIEAHGGARLIEIVPREVEASVLGDPVHPELHVPLDAGALDQLLPVGGLARRIGSLLLRVQDRARGVAHAGVARRRLQHLEVLLRVHHGGQAVGMLTRHVRFGGELGVHAAGA